MRSVALFILILLYLQLEGQKKYEFDFTEKSLYEAVEELSGRHKFKFSYNPQVLKTHRINRKVKANSKVKLISKIFEGLPFNIQLSDGVYLIIPKKTHSKAPKLSGQIYDQATGQPFSFSHAQVNNNKTLSNQDEKLTLPIREDTITFHINRIGYESLELEVPPIQYEIALTLKHNPFVLQEVVLNSKEFNKAVGKPGFFSLNSDQFNVLPVLGETDVFKSLQLLPGIRATDETSSGLAVRGSSPSQSLIMVDGFTLYHLDHFFEIFSTLNPNVVNNINVYKGGFGAEYGGRTSSVVDVTGKIGSTDKCSAGIGVNFLSLNGFIETPLGSKSTLFIAGRRSFTDIIDSKLYRNFLTSNRKGFLQSINSELVGIDLESSFYFYDLNGKFQHQFSNKSVLTINLFFSDDVYNGDSFIEDDFFMFRVHDRANWSNAGISADWKKRVSSRWNGDFVVSASNYLGDGHLDVNHTFFKTVEFDEGTIESSSKQAFFSREIRSSVGDLSFKSDHLIKLNSKKSLKAGVALNSIATTDYNFTQSSSIDFASDSTLSHMKPTSISTNESEYPQSHIRNLQADIFSLYGGYQFDSKDFLSNIGLRSSYYAPTGKWYVEPRISLRFKINDRFHLKGATSYHHQFVNQASSSASQDLDQLYWVLVDEKEIPIQKSTHLIIGSNYSFENWTIDVEYYRKTTSGITENKLSTLVLDILEPTEDEDVDLSGENNSEGLDIFLKYRNDTYTSWLSYSLGTSQDEFWYRNDNAPYPSKLDQRHEINFVNSLKLGKWELASVFIFGSGKPFTPPNPNAKEKTLYDLSRINENRFPNYSRLDFSAKRSFSFGKSDCEAGATLFNIFGRENIN